MSDKRFGRLVVMYRVEDKFSKGGTRKTMWHCRCDCGVEKDVSSNNLNRGATRSCGCLNREVQLKTSKIRSKKYNTYNIFGNYGVGWTSNTNKEFYFDLEDYEKIKEYCWLEDTVGYISTNLPRNNNNESKMIRMHRLLFDNPENMDIDHINHNTFDNRKINLRRCKHYRNLENRVIAKNNTSGNTGVYYAKSKNKWMSIITIKRKSIFIGYFDNIELAIKARLDAEKEYFGEYSINNDNLSQSSKNQKAAKLGIPIITEKEYIEISK